MPRKRTYRGGQFVVQPHQIVGYTPGQPMRGGDFWSDFSKGFTGTLDVASKALPFLPLLGLGKGRGRRRRAVMAPVRSRILEA